MNRPDLLRLTTESFAAKVAAEAPLVILLPLGSVEPHGPHLSLLTDLLISEAACERAARMLEDEGYGVLIAPAVPYGVTDCAEGFAGAVSIPKEVLTAYLRAVTDGFLATGAEHVCLVNNHLEPAQDQAVRAAIEGRPETQASVACPLTRRWARTLTREFKKGECHAGRYETSIVMAAAPEGVDEERRRALPERPISLSEKLMAGITRFKEMGLSEAYAGAPAEASVEEGKESIDKLAQMILGEVREALEAQGALRGKL